jgi:hypothetical protein
MHFTGDEYYDPTSCAVGVSSSGPVSAHCQESALRSPCEQDTWTNFIPACWFGAAVPTDTKK